MSKHNLGIFSLISLCVGAMIGSGIFAIPQNAAAEAGPGAALIAWGITAIGMATLAFVFMDLSMRRPDLNAGVYSYAKEGFGTLVGFASAWGYWVSAVLGNVSYIILIFSSLGYFFPIFGEGNTLIATCLSSVLIWILHFMVLRGIKEAAGINLIVTVSKILPISLFILVTIACFQLSVFSFDMWSFISPEGVSKDIFSQVRGMMLTTVWVFIGIEGASLFSERAKKREDIAKATLIGFFIVFALLVLVTMLSYGIMERAKLAGLSNPSTSYVMKHMFEQLGFNGNIGVYIMSGGLLISILGALLAWVLFSAEILFQASKDKSFPRILSEENEQKVPVYALFLSNLVVQIFIIITYFNMNTYNSIFYLATSMILLPYFFSTMYGLKYSLMHNRKWLHIFIYSVAVFYSVWLIYAPNIKYLILSSILYLFGLPLYIKAAKENNVSPFKGYEKIIVFVTFILAIYGIYGLWIGKFTF